MSFVDVIVGRLDGQSVRVRRDTTRSRRLLETFPFAIGRVDWRRVPGALTGAATGNVTVALEFLEAGLASLGIDDAWVAFCSDSIEEEFEVRRDRLREVLEVSRDVPDHKYVHSLECRWCFMWTMEDDLYFGAAPQTRAVVTSG
jgi:hypothetical protein